MKNEPAFPNTPEMMIACGGVGGQGMSLRDYFAAKAMQGLIMKWSLENGSFRFEDPEGVSAMSYKFADAMLVERDR